MRSIIFVLVVASCTSVGANAQVSKASHDGSVAGSGFGSRVAGIGDVDGDGHGEVAAGAPGTVGNPLAFTPTVVIDGATGAVAYTVGPPSPVAPIAPLCDVSGDAVPDFAWSDSISVSARSGVDGAALWTMSGPFLFTPYAADLVAVGDLDGDLRSEVLIGAPGGVIPSSPATIDVRSGATGALLLRVSPPGGVFSAKEVGAPGDVDADGFPDLAWQVSGGTVAIRSGFDGSSLYDLTGSGVTFGTAIAGVGDANVDGFDDFAISAPGADPIGVGTDAGRVTVYSGATGVFLWTSTGEAGDLFGTALDSSPDWNGDGARELIIGAPGAAGGAGGLRVRTAAGGAQILAWDGTAAGGRLGSAVADGGDVDADGFRDVLAGAPLADPGGLVDAGAVQVVSEFGVPAGSALFGAGCAGVSTGQVPGITASGGLPSITGGNPDFEIHLSHARQNAPGLVLVGTSNSLLAGSVPLPLALAPLGVPGCTLDVSLELIIAVVSNAGGTVAVPFPIPSNPAFAGVHVYFQGYVSDPGPALLPGAMSRGLDVLLH